MNDTSAGGLETWLRNSTRERLGRDFIYDGIAGKKTALVVVDMQNYFMKPGFLAACPMAIEVVPAINKLAENLRAKGGVVVWVQTTAAPEATQDWGVYKGLFAPESWERRNLELSESHEGYALWPELDVLDQDLIVKKTRFSAFIHGSSDLDEQLKAKGVDTLLISGVATGVCCESTARDGMMLNYQTVMVSDALAASTTEAHESSLKALYGMFCDVQTVDQIDGKLLA